MALAAIVEGVRPAGGRGMGAPATIAEQRSLGDIGFGVHEILMLDQASSAVHARIGGDLEREEARVSAVDYDDASSGHGPSCSLRCHCSVLAASNMPALVCGNSGGSARA
jgi:hypothetical protein